MKKTYLALASLLLFSSAASAHSTGHDGNLAETAQHVATEPDHLLMILAAVAIVAVVYFGTRMVLQKRK